MCEDEAMGFRVSAGIVVSLQTTVPKHKAFAPVERDILARW